MQLWTHHPSSFRLDALVLPICPERGQYWTYREKNFRYGEMATKLWTLLGTKQFLWCCTVRDMFIRTSEDVDLVEWEIIAPAAKVIAYLRASVWEDLVWTRKDDWDSLILNVPPTVGHKDILALVSLPLEPGCVRCHGQLRPQFTREKIEHATVVLRNSRSVDSKLLDDYDFNAST